MKSSGFIIDFHYENGSFNVDLFKNLLAHDGWFFPGTKTTVLSRIIKLSFTLINVFYYNNQNKPGYIELYIIFIIFINDTEEVQKSKHTRSGN
jgi:hypothetical protein